MKRIDAGIWFVFAMLAAVLAVISFIFFIKNAWFAIEGCDSSCLIYKAKPAENSFYIGIALAITSAIFTGYGIYCRFRSPRHSNDKK
jgi:hypothetical protein